MLLNSIRDLDRVLRGEKTQLTNLRNGTVDVSFPGFATIIVVLGAITGACMGVFALFHSPSEVRQIFASAVKVPLLFLMTLAVTFPSLYVFNALVGSRLRVIALSKLLIASLGVTVALTSAFGPIVAFFSLSTTSYPFMILLNVVVYAVGGLLGLFFLLQTLHRITSLDREEPQFVSGEEESYPMEGYYGPHLPGEHPDEQNESPGPLEDIQGLVLAGHVKTVFRCWVVVFALVGAQMSWVLRPFIGSPNHEFSWFRERGSNFFAAVFNSFINLF